MKTQLYKVVLSIGIMTLIFISGHAQKYGKIKGSGNLISKTRYVGSFTEVSVSGSFDVELIFGKEGEIKIEIEDNLFPYLVTEVKNGNLKIRWKTGTNIQTRRKVDLKVYYKNLDVVSLAGSGDIMSREIIKSDNFEMVVSGSGDIRLNVEANELSAAVSGSGDIDLKGASKNFTAAIAGSGDIKAVDLHTDKASLKISGSGGMTITVNKELEAKIAGSGDIKYRGNPKIEDIKVSGSGNVKSY